MRRVLVLADRQFAGDAAVYLLDLGTRVRTSIEGEAALRMLQVWAADLLIASSRLPVDVQRAKSICPGLKVLLLRDSVGGDEAGEAAADSVLVEPYEHRVFDEAVRRLLKLPSSSQSVDFETMAELVRADGDKHACLLVKLSPSGCEIETGGELGLSDPISLRFYLPQLSTPIEVSAVVLSTVDDDDLHLALEFLDLEGTPKELIEAFCEHLGGAREGNA